MFPIGMLAWLGGYGFFYRGIKDPKDSSGNPCSYFDVMTGKCGQQGTTAAKKAPNMGAGGGRPATRKRGRR